MAAQKKWYTSKTLWANVIALVIALVAALIDSAILPAKVIALWTSIALPVLNVALRLVTGAPLEMPGAKPVEAPGASAPKP